VCVCVVGGRGGGGAEESRTKGRARNTEPGLWITDRTQYSRTALIRINWGGESSGYTETQDNLIFLKIGYTSSLQFGCYYLQYVAASKPVDHA
jgi:hypothetical protein